MTKMLMTQYVCEGQNCGKTMLAKAEVSYMDVFSHGLLPQGWEKMDGHELCPDCVKAYRKHIESFFTGCKGHSSMEER